MNVALFQKEDKTINGALLFKKKKRQPIDVILS